MSLINALYNSKVCHTAVLFKKEKAIQKPLSKRERLMVSLIDLKANLKKDNTVANRKYSAV